MHCWYSQIKEEKDRKQDTRAHHPHRSKDIITNSSMPFLVALCCFLLLIGLVVVIGYSLKESRFCPSRLHDVLPELCALIWLARRPQWPRGLCWCLSRLCSMLGLSLTRWPRWPLQLPCQRASLLPLVSCLPTRSAPTTSWHSARP